MNDEPALYGLKRSILDQIITVLRQNPGVEEILLFGSRAKVTTERDLISICVSRVKL